VGFVKTVVTLLMLAVWPLASMHCKLETLTGLEFLRCEVADNGTKDCQGDDCKNVEEAAFKAPDSQNVLPAAIFLPDAFRIVQLIQESSRAAEPTANLNRIPPELPTGWLFSYRVAPPPRAPSFTA